MTIPVVAVSVVLVVCAFNGGVLGTGMLGASAEAAKSTKPDPTIPVPLSSGPSAPTTPSAPTPTAPVIMLTPPPPSNIPYIVLTPPDASGQGPAGPSVPAPPATVPVPPPPPATLAIVVPTTKPASKPAKTTTTTTTRPKKVSQTTTTVVAYDLETIQALPPTSVRPNTSVGGVVILADASKGTSGAGGLTPPTTPAIASPTTPPTTPPIASPTNPATTAAPTPLPTVPVPLASAQITTQTTFSISPLPTVLITPVLTRNTPTVPTTAPPSSVPPTVPVPIAGDASMPADTVVPTIPTTTKPKVYVFVGRQDYDIIPPVSPLAADVVTWALAQVGQPYLWGGEGVGGFDCSGLSKMAWLSVGVRLTHQSAVQFKETVRLNVADLEPGDLVFYGDPIHHLGIYIGDGKMVEAPRQGIPVRISAIKRRDLVGAGRIRY
jgi:peptidoglycan DL-endopeptidase CwlO